MRQLQEGEMLPIILEKRALKSESLKDICMSKIKLTIWLKV